MQVRYQAAPRPDRFEGAAFPSARLRPRMIRERAAGGYRSACASAAQNAQHVLKLAPDLPHDLLRLRKVLAGFVTL
jgi:hypothetical protein